MDNKKIKQITEYMTERGKSQISINQIIKLAELPERKLNEMLHDSTLSKEVRDNITWAIAYSEKKAEYVGGHHTWGLVG